VGRRSGLLWAGGALGLGLGLLGAARSPARAASPETPGAAALATAWQTGGCALCHAVPGQAPAARKDSCADCHDWIRTVASEPQARETARRIFPLWDRYERNVHSFLAVPSLGAAMARLDPAWVDAYLQDPHDLRPRMPEGMPRFSLDDQTRGEIVAAFAQARVDVKPQPRPDAAKVAWGQQLFVDKGCAACHSLGERHTDQGLATAPDLAWTRQRMSADMAAAWIAEPSAISPEATMPALGLDAAEVLAVRDYVLLAPLSPWPAPPAASLPAPVERPVSYAEVDAEVFAPICVHCHMDPAQNEGRRGPGNAGGFGWPETGIELQTYEGVVAVADRIPDVLLRRRQEAPRDELAPGQAPALLARPERPGMPLGLPPLTDAQTSLILGWIAQGMPR